MLAARDELQRAVDLDPGYSAAWKLFGKACLAAGDRAGAAAAWEHGIAVASERGDQQAAKEMTVFPASPRSKPSPTTVAPASSPRNSS